MNKHALLPTFIVFLLPFLNDLIVFGGSGQMDKVFVAPVGLIGNAIFAAIPFLLIGSAMKPRPRVTRSLWMIAITTVAIWLFYAVTGLQLQNLDDSVLPEDKIALNFYIYMFLMVWPFVAVIFMGIIAKFGEPPEEG